MPRSAWAYFWTVLLVGLGSGVWASLALDRGTGDRGAFAVFVALATVAQLVRTLSEVRTGRAAGTIANSPVLVFFLAGVLILPPSLFVLLVVIPHVVELGKEYWTRSGNWPAWYVQPFNIASHIGVGLFSQWAYQWFAPQAMLVPAPIPFVPALAAILTYLLLNHLVLGTMLVLARGSSWRETRLFAPETLVSDGIMLMVGYVFSVLWVLNPLLSIPALAPVILVQQALLVPQLRVQASTDFKTGLYNAAHFHTLFSAELKRAQRFGRPMALIVADLDLLRNVNNTYGHLAGDAVLFGIGQIIRETIREYDIAARFGGEEFAIAMPESGMDEARIVSERIRTRVQATRFRAPTVAVPFGVTISVGIACFPEQATQATELFHQADLAVYKAKQEGRNRVVCAAALGAGS